VRRVTLGFDAPTQRDAGGVIGFVGEHLCDHRQGALVVSLGQVDLCERERRDRRRPLPLCRFGLGFPADGSGCTGQVQPVVDDAGNQVTRHAEPAARAPARLWVGFTQPHDLVAQLDSGHDLGSARTQRACTRYELIARKLVELGIGGHRAT
jgi:hypothetical protein